MGYAVSVVASRISDFTSDAVFYFSNSINRKKAANSVSEILSEIAPEIIVCDTPLAVFYATQFVKDKSTKISIIYDITEFYPSWKNLQSTFSPLKPLKKVLLQKLFKNACRRSDGFIFGEKSKSLKPLEISPSKPSVFLPYYPDLRFITRHPLVQKSPFFSFFYAGNATKDKGYEYVVNLVQHCSALRPDLQFELNVISYTPIREYLTPLHNLQVNYLPFLDFPDFCKQTGKYDLYLDLREMTEENRQCLPIKLFYYMAFGRPVLFSDLDAIRAEIPEMENIGYLVQPSDYQRNAELVIQLIDRRDWYEKYCENAAFLANSKYNWDNCKADFIHFIQQFRRHESH